MGGQTTGRDVGGELVSWDKLAGENSDLDRGRWEGGELPQVSGPLSAQEPADRRVSPLLGARRACRASQGDKERAWE